jgi:hypothetical protein
MSELLVASTTQQPALDYDATCCVQVQACIAAFANRAVRSGMAPY